MTDVAIKVKPLEPLENLPSSILREPAKLARSFGVVKRTVTKAIERGNLPAIRVGFQWFTTEAEFLRWLRSGENRAGRVPVLKNPDPAVRDQIPAFLLESDAAA